MSDIEGIVRQATELLNQAHHRGYKAGQENAKESTAKAYKLGFEDGFKKGVEEASNENQDSSANEEYYLKGLNDAWAAVKRIESLPKNGGLTNHQIKQAFGQYVDSYDLYNAFTAEKTIELLKDFDAKEKKAKEINVGDVVWNSNNYRFAVVLRIYGEDCIMVAEPGYDEPLLVHTPPRGALKKTGKRIEIETILKKEEESKRNAICEAK